MEQKNDMLGVEDIVFMLLETLKSNGTFDEIRRHCVTDIDAKPTYQNWKQRIESNVNKFLSKVKYTPELNKNTVRERLRKHLLDGRETQDIEEGADRILTQVLAPRTLSIFEPKIAVAVDEYLGIKNEAPPIEINGLKESSMNSINVSNIENSNVFNPKIDFIPVADNIPCDKTQKDDRKDLRSDKKEKSSSLCKEPKSLNGNRTDDENDTEGSLKQKSSQHKNKTCVSEKSKSSSTNHKSNKKENSCKEVVDKSKDIVDKSKDIVDKSKDIVDKSKDVINKNNDIVNKPKDIIDKSKDVVNKSKDVSKPKDIVDKSKDVNKPKDNVDKSKDIINKSKDVNDKSKDIVSKAKDMVDKSKDKFLSKNSNSNSSSHKSNRTDTKRTKRSLEEKKKSSSLCKEPKLLNGNRSDDESNAGGSSKQKSTIHKNKSSSSDKSKSSSSNHKSSRKDNTSTDVVDKSKEKSLSKNSTCTDVDKSKNRSLSKNSNKTVDKSKDKSLSKNSSSTDIDKSKDKSLSKSSSSTNIDKSKDKSSLKNSSSSTIINKSKDKSSSKISNRTVDKSKDKSLSKNSSSTDIDKSKNKSLVKNSTCSSHKSNRNDSKRLKLSQPENNKLPINNESVEENKSKKPEEPEWNDFRSANITNDEQDAANVLLSMSTISYESSHSEIITENIIFIENTSPISETLKMPKIENELDVIENVDQKKVLLSSDNDDIKENSQLKSNNLETSQLLNTVKSVPSIVGHLFEKVCSVDIERLPCKDIKLPCKSVNNVEIPEEHQEPAEIKVNEKELNIENNLDPSENEKTNECISNDILKVPKLKLKLLPNQIDSLNKCKRKKHHKDKEHKKLKLSTSFDIPNEVNVPVIDNVSSNIMCEKLEQKSNSDTDVEINDSASTLSKQILCEEIKNNSVKVLDDDKSHYSFKGFSEAEAIPCKNYKLLKNVIKTLKANINNHDVINDGFKGFTCAETHPCKHRDIVYAELIKLKDSISSSDFIGFSEEDAQMSIGHKYVIKQLELAKKQNNVDNNQQNVTCGGNGIQNGKTFNEVMAAYLYKSNNDNVTTPKEIYNKPITDTKKDCPTVNNNNHNHDNWVVEQEMKYKLLPVKVKLERLMEYGCNNAKRVSDSSQVPI